MNRRMRRKQYINQTKKIKNKNFDKIEELEIELVKIKNSNKPDKLEKVFKDMNTPVTDLYLHQIKGET